MMTQISFRRPAALTGAVLVALTLALAPARAATVVYDATTLPTAATPNPEATSTSGVGVTLVEGVTHSIEDDRRSPWDAPNETAVDHTAATSVYSALRNGTATFEFGRIYRELSLLWGTPGPGNILTLFLTGTTDPVLTLNGRDGPGAFSGDRFQSVLVTISDLKFDRMVIQAGNPAFEFANLKADVPVPAPVPAASLLLVGALGGLLALRRRKTA